ncbi:hypothetical protein M422DRAFT_50978 [Sphaerobolus stellatus SS14]|uniref:Uncharacterized protein n=1 Tax=Sphaerobolus stellatus (strain SS14) TaxID=990650 RepID=A0A0C9V4M0_SPHS4|nr:hypothetical protein M422DRAFT_50978 [Sphaerobolus stellatus SS14]
MAQVVPYNLVNLTWDDLSNTFVFLPTTAWTTQPQGEGVNSTTFLTSSEANATVTVVFPGNATGFRWQGFKQSEPALYSICVDFQCVELSQAFLIDGHIGPSDDPSIETTIFSEYDLDERPHNITITNLVDPRTGRAGIITLTNIVVANPDFPSLSKPSGAASTSSIWASAIASVSSVESTTSVLASPTDSLASHQSSTNTLTAIAELPSSPGDAYWDPASNTTTTNLKPSSSTPVGVVVGATVSGAVILFGLLGLLWWSATRKRDRNVYNNIEQGNGHIFEKKKLILDPELPILGHGSNSLESADRFSSIESQLELSTESANFRVPRIATPVPAVRPEPRPLITISPHRRPVMIDLRSSPYLSPSNSLSKSSIISEPAAPPFNPPVPDSPQDWGEIPVGFGNPFHSTEDDDIPSNADFNPLRIAPRRPGAQGQLEHGGRMMMPARLEGGI